MRAFATRDALHKNRLFALAAGHFINDSYSGFLAPLLPLLMEKYGFSLAVAGMLASVFTFSTSFLQPAYGWLNDKLGRRAFVYLGPIVTATFICLIGYAPSVWVLVLLLLLSGSGTASFHPSGSAAVAKVSGRRQAWSMSLFLTAGNFGHSLGPVIVIPIVLTFGFSYLPLAVLPALAVGWLLFKLTPLLDRAKQTTSDLRLRDVLAEKSRSIGLHLFMAISRATAITAFGTFLPILAKERGLSLMWGSVGLTIFIAIGSFGALLGGFLADRLDRKKMLVFSFACSLPFIYLFLHIEARWSLILLVSGGFLLYLTLPLNLVMAQQLFPGREATMAAMMIGLGWGTGGLLMTPLGAIAEHYSLTTALQTVLLLNILATIAGLFLPREEDAMTLAAAAEQII